MVVVSIFIYLGKKKCVSKAVHQLIPLRVKHLERAEAGIVSAVLWECFLKSFLIGESFCLSELFKVLFLADASS